MPNLRSYRGRFRATVTAVGGNDTVTDARYATHGQFNNFTPPPLAERVLFTRDTGQPLQERVTGGLEDMDCVFELGAPNDLFKRNLHNTIQMQFYVAEELGSRGTNGVRQYDKRVITVHGVVNRVEDGTITFGEANPQTVTVRVTDLYKETVTPHGGTETIIANIDPTDYVQTFGATTQNSALKTALGL